MKKHHLINSITGNCFCGINPDNQLIAFDHKGDWFDSTVHPIDHTNYKEVLCVNCMKQFDMQLIEKFEMDAFLIDYDNRIPQSGRAMKFFKCQSRRNRRLSNQSPPTEKPTNQLPPTKEKPINQSKATDDKCVIIAPPSNQSIAKTAKGKKRAERKANQSKKKNQLKDKPNDDIIELKDVVYLLPDHNWRNQSKEETKEVIENVDPSDNWSIGDPIDDDSIIELMIGDDWKLIRHSKKLNQWKFVKKAVIKGKPDWIDESEWIDYKDASELIIEGYCE